MALSLWQARLQDSQSIEKFRGKDKHIPTLPSSIKKYTRGHFKFQHKLYLWRSPFPGCPKPLFQSEAKCKTIDMNEIFYSHAKKKTNSFSQERMGYCRSKRLVPVPSQHFCIIFFTCISSAQECFIPNIPDFKLSYLVSFLEWLISTTYEFAEFKAFQMPNK